MRLNKFESVGQDTLGEGVEKKVFVNPKNEGRVISEGKKDTEKDTPCQLKGRYYLTKIAHLLLPQNIPDIYQVRESSDGKQTVDTERISHTPEHARLQEILRSGGDEELAIEQSRKMVKKMGAEMGELDLELERIGLSFNIDDKNVGNYTKDEKGNVYYLETFKPWETDPANPKELEVLFDEEELREAINGIPDQKTKEKSTQYMERLLALLEEEKQEQPGRYEASLMESGPHIEELETILAPFIKEDVLVVLGAIETEEEAENSTERSSAGEALISILNKLHFLEEKTDITVEKYNDLHKKYKILCRAVGIINRRVVDHDR